MFKLIRKSIKNIDFHQTAALLTAKYSGMVAFWIMEVVGGINLILGIFLWIGAEDILFFLLFGGLGSFLVVYPFFGALFEWFEFNQSDQTFRYYKGTFQTKKDSLRAKVKKYPFSTLTIDWEVIKQFGSTTIQIQTEDGFRYLLSISQSEYDELIDWISGKTTPSQSKITSAVSESGRPQQAESVLTPSSNLYQQKDAMGHATMLTEIKSWGRSSLLLGVIHIVASGFLNPGWGVTLLAVGGLSFLVQEASMFVLYAVALVWVGVSNILSTELGLWTLFGIYQIYLGIRLFGKYKRYQDYEQHHLASLNAIPADIKTGRAARLFPWVGSGLSIVGLLVYGGTWVFLFISLMLTYAETQTTQLSESFYSVLELVGGVALGLGIVGFALSLAAVLSKYTPRWLAWLGVVLGGLLVLIEILLNLWILFSV